MESPDLASDVECREAELLGAVVDRELTEKDGVRGREGAGVVVNAKRVGRGEVLPMAENEEECEDKVGTGSSSCISLLYL